jgi:hypothetical protein
MFEVINLGGIKTTTSKAACNHCYCVDVSGSMSYDLPKIRQHLKNIISVVTQPEDTMTVIWFSGKGQCGVVFENLPVSDVSTVQMMHTAIDKWLKPVGLTGFVDPINLAKTIAFAPNKMNNFVFLSDGYDNQSTHKDILERVSELQTVFHSITFIEYGFYADRELLSKMAQQVGGLHIFAEGYNQYDRVFTDAISGAVRVNNITVSVNKRAKHCVFIYNDDQIRIVPVIDGQVTVPEDTQKIYSVVPKDVLSKQLSAEHLYLIVYYASKTDNSDLVWKCLEALGDVALVKAYSNAFTKQELSQFEALVELAVLDESKRFIEGRDLNAVPNKNTPTVLDLLNTLSEVDAELRITSSYWEYNKTSRSRESADGDKTLPRFEYSELDNSVPLHGLVFNSSRPNVSIQTTRSGRVVLPENDFGLESVPSFVTRNYTIIRDGIKNVKVLPIVVTPEGYESLKSFPHEVIESNGSKKFVIFNIESLPVVNRSSVESVSSKEMIDAIRAIEILAVRNKVIKYRLDSMEVANVKTAKMAEKYGQEAADWLSSIGVRDYGFSPVGTTGSEVSDVYEAISVSYKIKGMSSIPAVGAVIKKADEIKQAIEFGKPSKKSLNLPESLIIEVLDELKDFKEKDLLALRESSTKRKRMLEVILAKKVFALILGRKWFADTDEFESEIDFGERKTQITLIKSRETVKI